MIVQTLMDRLRPLVGLKGWDYCVLWKYIELMDCCCAGTGEPQNGEALHFPLSPVIRCRDVMFQHPRITSCEHLAQLPSSMPLDSGIYAEASIKNQTKWLDISSSSDSTVMGETVGTRILIPVAGGLIELFVAKQVSEDQNLINFITAQLGNMSLEEEAAMMSANNCLDASYTVNMHPMNELQSVKPFLGEENQDQQGHDNNHLQPSISPVTALENLNLPVSISLDRIRLCDSPMSFLQNFSNYNSENKTKDDIFFEGSHEMQKSIMENTTTNMHMQLMEPLANNEQQGNDIINEDSIKQQNSRAVSISDCSDQIDDEDCGKYRRRTGKPQSKNLVAERKRRQKLNDRLYSLRALVPNISKLDRASILGDAIEFVKDLQSQAKALQDELEDNSEDDDGGNKMINGNPNIFQSEILNPSGTNIHFPKSEHEKVANEFHMGASGNCSIKRHNQDMEINNGKGQQMEAQVEVSQIDGNEFFVKVFCEHKPGGFFRLLEALSSLGLEVTNINVTSFRGLVSNVLKLQKKDSGMVEADHVRDSLLELTRPRGWSSDQMAKASDQSNGDIDYHHQHHLHNPLINSHQHHHLHHFHG